MNEFKCIENEVGFVITENGAPIFSIVDVTGTGKTTLEQVKFLSELFYHVIIQNDL